MPAIPNDRFGQYFLALAVVALILFARTGLLYDDIRTAIEVAGLVFGVPLLTFGVVAGAAGVHRKAERITHRLDRLLAERSPDAGPIRSLPPVDDRDEEREA